LVRPAHLFELEGGFNGVSRAEVRYRTFERVGCILQLRRVSARDCLLNLPEGARALLNKKDRNFLQQLSVATDARQRQLAI
jgi:hypothetical protein